MDDHGGDDDSNGNNGNNGRYVNAYQMRHTKRIDHKSFHNLESYILYWPVKSC